MPWVSKSMQVEVELDVDRVALLDVTLLEDLHYPLEQPRPRLPTVEEGERIRCLLAEGKFVVRLRR